MIKWKQAGMNMASFGMDLTNPDFVKHAESMGAHGHRVDEVRRAHGFGRTRCCTECAGQLLVLLSCLDSLCLEQPG